MEPTYTQNTQQTVNGTPQIASEPAREKLIAGFEPFELSDGTTVEFVNAVTTSWMRARKLSGSDLINSSFYCLAEIARFNGEKKTLQYIKELPICDGLLLESKFNELGAGKK